MSSFENNKSVFLGGKKDCKKREGMQKNDKVVWEKNGVGTKK